MTKQLLIVSLAVLTVFGAQAQPTEAPDYRSRKESVLKVMDKSLRGDLTAFTIGGIEESIGKAPLRKINPSAFETNQLRFKAEELDVIIETAPFDARGKKLMVQEKALVKINNKPYYGNYGDTPVTEIKKVTVVLGSDSIAIPPSAYADLYNLRFTYQDPSRIERSGNALYFSPDDKRMYIYLLSRDRTGSYEVTWVIENKQYLRRVLDYGFSP